MPQPAKKPAANNNNYKPAATSQKTSADTEGMNAVNNFSRASEDMATLFCDNCNALMESGTASSRALQNIGTEMVDSLHRSYNDMAALSLEGFSCKTVDDVMALQQEMTQQLSDHYFGTTNKLWELLLDSWEQALEPLNEHIAWFSKSHEKASA